MLGSAGAGDRRGLAVAGQEGGDVAVLSAVGHDGLAEAGPAGGDVGDDPLGDRGPGLRVGRVGHAVMMAWPAPAAWRRNAGAGKSPAGRGPDLDHVLALIASAGR